ncbi:MULTISPECIES: TetR family transcriptional regulator [Streptomyces]|uniref:TetR family transcriptional regulator n=1 Tax=Streptomyces edwardsiae TaxID=3075527 RepID=A0ABU2PU87_9ACTN|nr:TetR family transcriptional regulator [Streptomyces sp. DSM 41636]MDT0395732.1 TetR family transcriptional regulator [Streptomyces sp. DSM 41636]
MPQPATTRKRTRDPEAKRAAILDAARATFAELGYERATIREIAKRAGVANGLITLHFSSKENLFIAAAAPQQIIQNVAGDLEGLPRRVASTFVQQMESGELAESFTALLRSSTSDRTVAREMQRAMREQSVAAYRQMSPDDDAEAKVEMIVAVLNGIALSRYVLADGLLAAMSPAEVIDRTTELLRTVVLG